jgi:hypothetical protein
MKRFITKRVLSSTNSLRSPRCFSQLAQKQTPLPENEIPVPKLPPFDYSPPPYTGPSAEEILAKRKEYLSPSLFHFFSKPVSLHCNSPYHLSRSFIFFFPFLLTGLGGTSLCQLKHESYARLVARMGFFFPFSFLV